MAFWKPSATAQRPSGAATTHPYRRRTPERNVLYRLVQEHLATWLALRDEDPECPVSAHVERELRTYLVWTGTLSVDTQKISYERGRRSGRPALPADLPRTRIEHQIPFAQRLCAFGECMERIGEESREVLDYVPAKLRGLEHVRHKYACACDEGGVLRIHRHARRQTPSGLLA